MNRRLHRFFAGGCLVLGGAFVALSSSGWVAAAASPAPLATTAATTVAEPTADPLPDCDKLKLGDAWAGVSLHCGLDRPTPTPTATEATKATIMPVPITTPKPAPTRVAPSPGTVPAPAQTAPTRCQEDDPCWDCSVMGNMICGTDPAMLGDAWASFDGAKVAGVVGKTIAFRAVYIGTSGASSIPGYWVVRSLGTPNTFHVFKISTGV